MVKKEVEGDQSEDIQEQEGEDESVDEELEYDEEEQEEVYYILSISEIQTKMIGMTFPERTCCDLRHNAFGRIS